MDLVMLSDELGMDPESQNSTFRLFLEYCPDALEKLFDRCFISEVTQKGNYNVILDLFLFKPRGQTHCELDVIDLIYESGRRKLLNHPIFETLIKLKWERSLKLFSLLFLHKVCHMISLLGFAISYFGEFREDRIFWWWFLFMMTLTSLVHEALKIVGFVTDIKKGLKFKKHLYELLNLIHTGIIQILGAIILITLEKRLTVMAVLIGGTTFSMAMTIIPRIGKNVFMTSQVMRTILEFLLSYSAKILAFTVAFHILLPGSQAFG